MDPAAGARGAGREVMGARVGQTGGVRRSLSILSLVLVAALMAGLAGASWGYSLSQGRVVLSNVRAPRARDIAGHSVVLAGSWKM